jgi:hypothetical protein
VIRLAPSTAALIAGLFDCTERFFGEDAAVKQCCTDPQFQYVGYVRRPIFEKELFQVRAGGGDNMGGVWNGAGAQLRDPSAQAMWALGQLANSCLSLACASVAVPRSKMDALREGWLTDSQADKQQRNTGLSLSDDRQNSSRAGDWSSSNLSLFRYWAARECVHCPQHSDVGLMTVIPTARGGAGLHIWDWKRETWLDGKLPSCVHAKGLAICQY